MTDSCNIFTAKAFAKLNLRLKVVGRRAEDGFHLLSMLNSGISLYDQLTVERAGEKGRIELRVNGDSSLTRAIGESSDNLTVKAARLFFDQFEIENPGIRISLDKNIPIGAGLGGGSSDAAAVLRILAEMFSEEIRKDFLTDDFLKTAATIGSDVPYFLKNSFSWVFGVGEVVIQQSFNPLAGEPVLLVLPEEHISTVEIYAALRKNNPDLPVYSRDLSAESLPGCSVLSAYGLSVSGIMSSGFSPDYPKILDLIDNDLTEEVLRASVLCSEIYDLLKQQHNLVVSVTGSGSAMFCLPRQQGKLAVLKNAQKLLGKLSKSQIVEFI